MIPILNHKVGRASRRLYKPERAPARKRGVLHDRAPVGCPNANNYEIAMAIASLCEASHVVPGRGLGYDPIADKYTIAGKSKATGKAQDFEIEGHAVALLINQLRVWNGGKFDKQGLTKAMNKIAGVR